mmetsp:Transcript_13241/g.31774  ORF Transcript_13241/g.31774 Transcript_13241/m.31774 type:complete len:89 (+) Transcript_13241:19-285(+)
MIQKVSNLLLYRGYQWSGVKLPVYFHRKRRKVPNIGTEVKKSRRSAIFFFEPDVAQQFLNSPAIYWNPAFGTLTLNKVQTEWNLAFGI